MCSDYSRCNFQGNGATKPSIYVTNISHKDPHASDRLVGHHLSDMKHSSDRLVEHHLSDIKHCSISGAQDRLLSNTIYTSYTFLCKKQFFPSA